MSDAAQMPTGTHTLKPVKHASNLPASKTRLQADNVVKKHVMYCAGVGLIPLPFFDQVMIGGLLGKMLHDLCKVYGENWSDHKVKIIISAVLGGAHTDWIPGFVVRTLGLHQGAQFTGLMILRPATAGAVAYTLGQWFVQHFESGAWQTVFDEKLGQPLPATE